ncbi:actin-histidine N-methyltransferase-like isoform X2 [Gordionus sp. m RMFG-2023]|uniref:actin-histidine N-methyltransferase-like isoform X2 n=1 Tax=Gordionus sp. m RMFG-2023 TaxID=3053472 RepID=UPI0031FBEECD
MGKCHINFPINLVEKIDKLCDNLLNLCIENKHDPTFQWHFKQLQKIYCIISQLMNLQEKYKLNFNNRNEYLSKFILWLKLNNLKNLEKFEIKMCENKGLGIYSTNLIRTNQTLTRINKNIILDSSSDHDLSLKSIIQNDLLLQKMQNVSLSLLLLEEMHKKDSFWKPYLDILPQTFNTPLYFSENDFEIAKSSLSFDFIYNHVCSISRQYVYIYRLLKKLSQNKSSQNFIFYDHFTYEDYRWAVSCVSTRQNRIVKKNDFAKEESILALIPFMDMFNHDGNLPMSIDYDIENQDVIIYAPKIYHIDQQICMNYGNRSSAQYLIHNGFIPDEINRFDEISLKFGLNSNDPTLLIKNTYLKELNDENIINDASNVFISSDNYSTLILTLNLEKFPLQLTAFNMLRIICMTLDDIRKLEMYSNDKKINNIIFESFELRENEIKSWKHLLIRTKLLSNRHTTILQQSSHERKNYNKYS